MPSLFRTFLLYLCIQEDVFFMLLSDAHWCREPKLLSKLACLARKYVNLAHPTITQESRQLSSHHISLNLRIPIVIQCHSPDRLGSSWRVRDTLMATTFSVKCNMSTPCPHLGMRNSNVTIHDSPWNTSAAFGKFVSILVIVEMVQSFRPALDDRIIAENLPLGTGNTVWTNLPLKAGSAVSV